MAGHGHQEELLSNDHHGCCSGHGHGHSHGQSQSRSQVQVAVGREALKSQMAPWSQSMAWLRAHDPAECPSHVHNDVRTVLPVAGCSDARCDHSVLMASTNIILLVRASELNTMSRMNTFLAFTAVLFMVMNIIGCILNSYDNDCNPLDPLCDRATSPEIFHDLEFWSTFIFNLVDLLALSYSPKGLSNQYQNPTMLKFIVLLNIGLSFCSCVLVSINLEKFEILSHEIEYFNEITMTVFDMMIFVALVRGREHRPAVDAQISSSVTSVIITMLALLVAVVQLGVYNLSGWTDDGDSKGEQLAHYLEFTFGFISAIITFWFTMDNRMTADKRLRVLMYGVDNPVEEL